MYKATSIAITLFHFHENRGKELDIKEKTHPEIASEAVLVDLVFTIYGLVRERKGGGQGVRRLTGTKQRPRREAGVNVLGQKMENRCMLVVMGSFGRVADPIDNWILL